MAEKPFVGGVLNMLGIVPGDAWTFNGPAFPQQVCYMIKFPSTYEAIEKLVLPWPLKADRNKPPEVIVWYFNATGSRAPNGDPCPYVGFQFRAFTEHKDVKGFAGWEFVDSVNGDKANVDILGIWGVQFGMAKKLADIRVLPLGNELEITVTRNHVTLVKMKVEIGPEYSAKELEALTSSPDSGFSIDTLTVRELPNEDWSKHLDRSVLHVPVGQSVKMRRAWHIGEASIEFGSSPQDPLAELKPGKVISGIIGDTQVSKDTFTKQRVLEKLA